MIRLPIRIQSLFRFFSEYYIFSMFIPNIMTQKLIFVFHSNRIDLLCVFLWPVSTKLYEISPFNTSSFFENFGSFSITSYKASLSNNFTRPLSWHSKLTSPDANVWKQGFYYSFTVWIDIPFRLASMITPFELIRVYNVERMCEKVLNICRSILNLIEKR